MNAMSPYVAGQTFALIGGGSKRRREVRGYLAGLGMVCTPGAPKPDLLVSCEDEEGPMPRGYVRDFDLWRAMILLHRPRDAAELGREVALIFRPAQLLAGKRVTVLGDLKGAAHIPTITEALGGKVVKAPDSDADVVICGWQDYTSSRLDTIRATAEGRLLLSEWQFYDMVEPTFTGLPRDEVQQQLHRDLMMADFAGTHARMSPYSVTF